MNFSNKLKNSIKLWKKYSKIDCFFLAKKIKNYTSFCRQFVIANRVA